MDYTGTGDGVDEWYRSTPTATRESSTVDGLTAIYTTGQYNRMATVDDGTDVWVYLHDWEGNTFAKGIWRDAVIDGGDGDGQIEIAEMVDTVVYTWDHRNRLVWARNYDNFAAAMADTPSQTVQYAYDFLNRLISRTLDADGSGVEPAVTEYFVHDGDSLATDWVLRELRRDRCNQRILCWVVS